MPTTAASTRPWSSSGTGIPGPSFPVPTPRPRKTTTSMTCRASPHRSVWPPAMPTTAASTRPWSSSGTGRPGPSCPVPTPRPRRPITSTACRASPHRSVWPSALPPTVLSTRPWPSSGTGRGGPSCPVPTPRPRNTIISTVCRASPRRSVWPPALPPTGPLTGPWPSSGTGRPGPSCPVPTPRPQRTMISMVCRASPRRSVWPPAPLASPPAAIM